MSDRVMPGAGKGAENGSGFVQAPADHETGDGFECS
jgi:hypothetical protein